LKARRSEFQASCLDDAGYRAAYAVAEDNLRLGRAFLAASVRLNLGCAATEVVTATGARSVREPFCRLDLAGSA
jgi:hypothetical protein